MTNFISAVALAAAGAAISATLFNISYDAYIDAQPTCYLDPVWYLDDIVVTSDVTYGSAYNAQTSSTQTLILDIYSPPDSDKREKRPAVVYIHGGAFTGGDKAYLEVPDWCKELARRGSMVFSINYRLTGVVYPATSSIQAVIDATEDARAAVRYLRAEATNYNIDTDRIFLMGDSAGAITALSYGYNSAAQGEGSSGNAGYSSAVTAIGSFAGSLKG